MAVIRLLLTVAFLLASLPAFAQLPAPPATTTASLTSAVCPGAGCTVLNVSGYASAAIQVTGTWTATLTFEVSLDGSTYQTVSVTPTNSTTTATTATSNGVWVVSVTGARYLRVRVSAYTSGTAVVTMQTALAGGGAGGGGGGGGGAVTITDGVDTAQVSATAGGSVQVECTSGCGGSGGTSAADGAAYIASTTQGTPMMGARDDAATGTLAEDKVGIARLTTNRELLISSTVLGATTDAAAGYDMNGTVVAQLREIAKAIPDNAAALATVNGNVVEVGNGAAGVGSLRVAVGTGSGLALEAGAVATVASAVQTEDAVHSSGHKGMLALCVSKTSPGDLSAGGTDGDYEPCQVDRNGALVVSFSAFPDNEPFNVAQWGSTNVVNGGTAGTVAIGGIQAIDAAISGNKPILVGGYASTTLPSAVSAGGDLQNLWLTLNGVGNFTIRDASGDAAVDATLDAVKVTNSTASTATSYLTARLSDGTNFLTPATDWTVGTAIGTTAPGGVAVYSDFDGAALPTATNVDTEGEAVPIAASIKGVQYVMLASEDGSLQYGTSTTPLVVGDGSGALNVICDSGCSGGTQYAEDAVHASGNTGTLALVVRNDAGTALAADGDNIPLMVNSAGSLYVAGTGTFTVSDGAGALNVICDSGCSGGTQYAEDAVHASGNTGTLALVVRNDAGTALAADGDNIPLMVNSAGSLYVAGTGSFTVTDGAGALNVICDSGCSGGTQYAEDAVHASGNTGTLALVVRNDAGTALAADGDNIPLMVNSAGSLYVAGTGTFTVSDGAGAMNVIIDSSATLTVTDGAGAMNTIIDSGTVTTVSTVTTLSQLGGVNLPVEDVGETAAGVGIYAMTVRRDTQASSAGTTGDNATLNTDANGNLWITSTYLEDAGETAGGQLSMAGLVRRDTAASSAGTTGDNATFNSDALGLLWTRALDPCDGVAKVVVPISISTATTTELVDATGASNKGYLCSLNLITAGANNVSLVEDATDACASPDAGMAGGTTAGTGWNFAANGGLTLGNGTGTVAKTASTSVRICLITSAAVQLSGTAVFAYAP